MTPEQKNTVEFHYKKITNGRKKNFIVKWILKKLIAYQVKKKFK